MTKEEVKNFLEKQIAECRKHRPEQVDDLLDKLIDLDVTYAFVKQVTGA